MEKDEIIEIAPIPKVSVLSLTFWDRLLGRRLSMPLPHEPREPSERDLAADLFWSLYRDLSPPDPPPPERAVNAALLAQLQAQPEWSKLLELCRGTILTALLAASSIWGSLLDRKIVREALEAQAAAEQDRQRAADLEAQAILNEAQGLGREAETLRSQARRLRQQAAAKAFAGVQILGIWEAQSRGIASLAYGEALGCGVKEILEALQEIRGWGLDRGELKRLPRDHALAILRHLRQSRLREIARLAGRLRGVALQARGEQVPVGHVPVGLGRTQDFQDILPEELAFALRSTLNILRAHQMATWASDGLLGLRRAQSRKEKGPLFIAVDVSDSMSGTREIVAKALALGLAMIASEERRDFRLVAFSSYKNPLIVVDASKIRKNPEALFWWAETSYGGGTNFDRPLLEAMAWIRRRRMADVVFISDGEGELSEEVIAEWRRFQKETGARLLYILVAHSYHTDAMGILADLVFHISELLPEDSQDLARQLDLDI